MTERTYAMTRLDRGDYLPSNDGTTLWRLHTYDEDGSASTGYGPDARVIRGTFWAVRYWHLPLDTHPPAEADDVDNWELWPEWAWGLKSRSEAIEDALRQQGFPRAAAR